MTSKRNGENTFSEQKIELLLKMLHVLIALIGTMSLIRMIEKDYLQAVADIVFLLIVIYGYYRLNKQPSNYLNIVRIVFASAIMASVFLLTNHPENPIRFIWISTVIYMVFYLFERREAAYWIAGTGMVLFILFLLRINGLQITLVDFLIWIMNIVIVLMIAYWYARIEKEASEKLLAAKNMLSNEVETKTRELKQRQKELEKKTQQLQILNDTLEDQIRIKTEKNLQQQEMLFRQARYAQMGEMISMIAHQWRQPLNAIATLNATVKLKNDMNRCDQAFLEEKTRLVSDYVHHLSSTIDDFRNFFRLDNHKVVKSVSGIIEDTLRLSKSALESKNICIARIEKCKDCKIVTYPNEVVHVVLNLLKNAEDAFRIRDVNDPVLTIRTTEDNGHARIEIEDNAGGIEEEFLEKIFDPYFTTKEENDGTGLGLYMSRTIIQDHCGGIIEVCNTERGALFSISLPIVSD
jgi:C4-dicarboxylate-specific signal transduction histidine kinase